MRRVSVFMARGLGWAILGLIVVQLLWVSGGHILAGRAGEQEFGYWLMMMYNSTQDAAYGVILLVLAEIVHQRHSAE